MRFVGTLNKWNEQRAFGFITPSEGGPDIFVHISALQSKRIPNIGELCSYEVETGSNGKLRAVKVLSLTDNVYSDTKENKRRPKWANFKLVSIISLVLMGSSLFSVNLYQKDAISRILGSKHDQLKSDTPSISPRYSQKFVCDGRQYCTQMTSCEEARYFLSHCPGVKMDGNNDGEPCEQQWCH
ncbi:MAG TPA: cold shock domain-containing protein [Methanosarcina sp.]|nr:cold shock domain-containing protein [Methanosarcina sp.]